MTRRELKKWRKYLGFTQDFAAFYIGMPFETYRSIEEGRRAIPLYLEKQLRPRRKIANAARQYRILHPRRLRNLVEEV